LSHLGLKCFNSEPKEAAGGQGLDYAGIGQPPWFSHPRGVGLPLSRAVQAAGQRTGRR